MKDVRKRCAEIFSRVFEMPVESVSDQSSPDDVEAWDSLAHVQLISELEEAFAIEINPDEGIELESFAQVVAYVESKLGSG